MSNSRFYLTAALALLSFQAYAWEYIEYKDDFSSEVAHAIVLLSTEQIPNALGELEHAILQLRCDKENGQPYWRLTWPNMLAVSRHYNNLIGWVEESQMQVRFDDSKIFKTDGLVGGWIPSEIVGTNQSVTTGAVGAILKRAVEAKTMMVRDVSFDGVTMTVSFPMQGISEAVQQLRPKCHKHPGLR